MPTPEDYAFAIACALCLLLMAALLVRGVGMHEGRCAEAERRTCARFATVDTFSPASNREEMALLHAGFTDKQLIRLDEHAEGLWRGVTVWHPPEALPPSALPFPLGAVGHGTERRSIDSFTLPITAPPPAVLASVVERARGGEARPGLFFEAVQLVKVDEGEVEELAVLCVGYVMARVPRDSLRVISSAPPLTVERGAGRFVPIPIAILRTKGGMIRRMWPHGDIPWESVLVGIDAPDTFQVTIMHDWLRTVGEALQTCLVESATDYRCRSALETWQKLRVRRVLHPSLPADFDLMA